MLPELLKETKSSTARGWWYLAARDTNYRVLEPRLQLFSLSLSLSLFRFLPSFTGFHKLPINIEEINSPSLHITKLLGLAWSHLVLRCPTLDSIGFNWIHLDSLGIPGRLTPAFLWTHLDPLGLTETHLDSLGLPWTHLYSLLDSLGLTWIHLVSLARILFHLISHDFTRVHLTSFDFTWFPMISVDFI